MDNELYLGVPLNKSSAMVKQGGPWHSSSQYTHNNYRQISNISPTK